MSDYTPENYAELLYEKVVILKYRSENTHGLMIVRESFYEKNINKFKRAFKNVDIYYMSECVLTEDILKELSL